MLTKNLFRDFFILCELPSLIVVHVVVLNYFLKLKPLILMK